MRLVIYLAVILAMIPVTYTSAAELDEQSVISFLKKIESMVADQRLDKFADTLTDDAQIIININTPYSSQTVTMNKEEYMDSVRQSWALYDAYSYRRDDVSLLFGDNSATVKSTVREEISLQGETISQSSQGASSVTLVDGKLKISRIERFVELE